MKRVLSFLLTIAMVSQMLVAPAFAAGTEGTAALTNVEAGHGETVEMTLSLAGFEDATCVAVGISQESQLKMTAFAWSEALGEPTLSDSDIEGQSAVLQRKTG